MADGDEATFIKALEVLTPKVESKRTLPPKPPRPVPDSYQIRQLARSYGEWGINRLAELAMSDDVPVPVRVDCIKTLLDRGYGRVQPLKEAVVENGDDDGIRITIRHVLDNIPGKPYKLIEGTGNGHAD